uniref:circumsporozoite protein-like n=1 Tax=Ictidomys tridecemlineatus TaxID=43179 RepID=UPI001A9CE9EE|nr:circumsporozoite protein-like [Ictidomys tridecemlineatus]
MSQWVSGTPALMALEGRPFGAVSGRHRCARPRPHPARRRLPDTSPASSAPAAPAPTSLPNGSGPGGEALTPGERDGGTDAGGLPGGGSGERGGGSGEQRERLGPPATQVPDRVPSPRLTPLLSLA